MKKATATSHGRRSLLRADDFGTDVATMMLSGKFARSA